MIISKGGCCSNVYFWNPGSHGGVVVAVVVVGGVCVCASYNLNIIQEDMYVYFHPEPLELLFWPLEPLLL